MKFLKDLGLIVFVFSFVFMSLEVTVSAQVSDATAPVTVDTNLPTPGNVDGANLTPAVGVDEVPTPNRNEGGGGGGRRNRSAGRTTISVVATPGTGQVLGAENFLFLNNLQIGMQGNEVMELQKRLRTEGFFTFPTNTGYFGPITLASVKAYQQARLGFLGNSYVTGFVGPFTRSALNGWFNLNWEA